MLMCAVTLACANAAGESSMASTQLRDLVILDFQSRSKRTLRTSLHAASFGSISILHHAVKKLTMREKKASNGSGRIKRGWKSSTIADAERRLADFNAQTDNARIELADLQRDLAQARDEFSSTRAAQLLARPCRRDCLTVRGSRWPPCRCATRAGAPAAASAWAARAARPRRLPRAASHSR